jgi:hypothetical protein
VADDDVERAGEQRPDPAGAAARSMTQLAQQMREMADRMLGGGLPGWPVPGAGGVDRPGADRPGADRPDREGAGERAPGAAGPARPDGGSGGATPGRPAVPGLPPMPGLPGTPPMPATMSARQVQAVVDDIAARRAQIQALVVQLTTFDEQLGTLETSLQPLLQWLRTWSDLEGAVTDFWTPRPPRS